MYSSVALKSEGPCTLPESGGQDPHRIAAADFGELFVFRGLQRF